MELNFSRAQTTARKVGFVYFYVVRTDNDRIQQFTMEGRFTGKTVTELQTPRAKATTPDGRIFVSAANKVYVLK